MELIFEISTPGHKNDYLAACDVPMVDVATLGERSEPLRLPEVAEVDLSRHYTELAQRTFGVNCGFYPLGSCTMKYNPKINEAMAGLPGFTNIHPLQPQETVQGALEAYDTAERILCEVTGMDRISFQPGAGAHGEWAGLLLMKAYHEARGDEKRKKIIIPDSAHGTNPASAVMAGFDVVGIATAPDGSVDIDSLKAVLGDDIAGLMLTNPSTYGLFESDILTITDLVHESGGLVYYDGANLNAIMGIVRPGDMGFDIIHLNLHKTFSTPHGGGGPGSGPVGCKAFLAPYLPGPVLAKNDQGYYWDADRPESVGQVKSFYGHFLVVIRALTYVLTLGGDGIRAAAQQAVLNANYMMARLKDVYPPAYDRICMHEYISTLAEVKKAYGVSALDIAKGLLDNGIHPPTMYFPISIPEALMFEPTETESKATMDEAIEVLRYLIEIAKTDADALHAAPVTAQVRRVDEVGAARKPKVAFDFSASVAD